MGLLPLFLYPYFVYIIYSFVHFFMVFTLCIVFTDRITSLIFVDLLGLANSLVWPAVWPLALEGVGKFTSAASGLLIMGIAGGAIIPLAYGQLADMFNTTQAYWIA